MTETSYTHDLSLAASPSEFSLLSLSNAPPPRSSARYLQVSELDDEKMAFNATGNTAREVLTKRITISGLRIVLEDAETCPVFKRLHERTNVRSLALCADEIIVRSPLHLPGTNVTISARVLTFAGTGRISTKPLAFDMPSDRPEGYDGQAGGSIQLYVRDLEAPGDIVRLITKGAKGQDAQPGEKGDDGSVVTPWDGIVKNTPTLWLGNEDLDWSAEVAVVVSTRDCTPIYASCQPWSDMRQEWLTPANWMAIDDIIKTGSEDWPTADLAPARCGLTASPKDSRKGTAKSS